MSSPTTQTSSPPRTKAKPSCWRLSGKGSATASKKPKIGKSQKAKQFFLTPSASKQSQICEIWRQKSQSGNPGSKSWSQWHPTNCDSQSALQRQEIYLSQWPILCVMMHVMYNNVFRAGVGNLRHTWTVDMACIRLFVTQVRVQQRVKMKLCDKQVLQPLRWRCVDCVIHHERDVREEQHHAGSAGLTIVANVAVVTGPTLLGTPRSSAIKPNLSHCI